MPKVKVWNDNKHEHVERFKGEEIRISPGGFIEMDYMDAVDFRGQFTPMRMLGPNNPDPRGFKMIRVEEPAEPIVKDEKNVFHATGKAFESQAELIEFAKAYAKANADMTVKHDELETATPAAESPAVADLKAEIAELRAMLQDQVARKKPGPKPRAKIA